MTAPATVSPRDRIRDALLDASMTPALALLALGLDEADEIAGIVERALSLATTARRAHRLSFFVPGDPITEGSMKSIGVDEEGRTKLVHDSRRLAPWRERIGMVARSAGVGLLGRGPVHGSVQFAASLFFVVARPKRHFLRRGKQYTTQLLPSAPHIAVGKHGDLDKLTRAVLDALTSKVYYDDSQVVDFIEPFGVRYPDAGAWWGAVPGVHIRVE